MSTIGTDITTRVNLVADCFNKNKEDRIMQTASKWLILANAIIAVSADASAQNIDVGKAEYQSACASCHGIDAKGNGPVTRELKTRPTDLTVLAKKNNGVFPVNSVYQIIDGRESIASHGTREMPIWGWRFVPAEHFNLKGADDYIYLPPASPEPVVHSRIMAVIDYLNRIQEK
ncbi:MAG: cytochrome c [Pseudolabrys sp.]